ncbi:hypothetical protein Ciccas_010669, partial [Cichlidogyrus casuarinus]
MRPLDREDLGLVKEGVLLCTDTEGHQITQTFSVNVLDMNDHAPQFFHGYQNVSNGQVTMLHFNVQENAEPGTELQASLRGQLISALASDQDTGDNARLRYKFPEGSESNSNFELDETTGRMRTRVKLDRESVSSHTLTLLAIDAGNPPLTSTALVQVEVRDENDNVPRFDMIAYDFRLSEEAKPQTMVGRLFASDLDSSGNNSSEFNGILYFLFPLTPSPSSRIPFTCNYASGEILTTNKLDREQHAQYHLN